MKLHLLLTVLLFNTFSYAQTSDDLRNFINKNNVAIRTVQKNMVHQNNQSYQSAFKELLKNQVAAVKSFASDQAISSHCALLVRNECLFLLKKLTTGSTEYFDFNEHERSHVKSLSIPFSFPLNTAEIRQIEGLEVLNLQSLNTLSLTIQ